MNILQFWRGVKLMKGLTLQCEFLDLTDIRLSEKDIEKTLKCEFSIGEDKDDGLFIHA